MENLKPGFEVFEVFDCRRGGVPPLNGARTPQAKWLVSCLKNISHVFHESHFRLDETQFFQKNVRFVQARSHFHSLGSSFLVLGFTQMAPHDNFCMFFSL
jgi:hypothetical protein